MPNRILKESIRESESINVLSDKAEICFYRLITFADDFGLFKSDPVLVLAGLFPRKDYRKTQVILWLNEIANAGMIKFYIGQDLKPYGSFATWSRHQQQRAERPKHPKPEEKRGDFFLSLDGMLQEINTIRYQMISDDIRFPRNPNPNPNPNLAQSKPNFARFWACYPKKKSKGQAEKAWKTINPDEQLLATMIAAIEQAKKSEQWQKDSGQFIPYPATWLNAKGWEDGAEVEVSPSSKKFSAKTCKNIEAFKEWLDEGQEEIRGIHDVAG